jgi:hypothetical protein
MYRGSRIIYSSDNFRNLNKFQNYLVMDKKNNKIVHRIQLQLIWRMCAYEYVNVIHISVYTPTVNITTPTIYFYKNLQTTVHSTPAPFYRSSVLNKLLSVA